MEENRGENGAYIGSLSTVRRGSYAIHTTARIRSSHLRDEHKCGLAGEQGYQLVAGRDSKLCAKVLEAFREDVDDRGRLRYQHEIFRHIIWKPVELNGQGPKTSSSALAGRIRSHPSP